MFVKLKKALVSGVGTLAVMIGTATGAIAADAPDWKSVDGTVPVTVTLDGITQTTGPIYVSIQTKDQYMSMKGSGGIIKTVTRGQMSETFNVPAAGDYSVSVWHDLDDDGRFSMDDNYKVLDGFGASGNAPETSRPTFDDVKVMVPPAGTDIRVKMKYPS